MRRQIQAILYRADLEVTLEKLKKSILPQGKVTCSVNVASLFSGRHDDDQADDAGHDTGLIDRIKKIEVFSTFLSHSAEVSPLVVPLIELPILSFRFWLETIE